MAFCNNTNIVGSIPTIELTGCEHGTLAVFASGGENALCDPLGSRVRYRELGRGKAKSPQEQYLNTPPRDGHFNRPSQTP